MIQEYSNLTSKEIDKINAEYRCFNTKDETIKQRQFNIDKLQEFKKIIYKTKKNRKKLFYIKYKNTITPEKQYIVDPYKFKNIPHNIKQIMNNLISQHDTSLQVVSYRINIPLYKLENFLYKKYYPLDGSELHKFLSYFNYELN